MFTLDVCSFCKRFKPKQWVLNILCVTDIYIIICIAYHAL